MKRLFLALLMLLAFAPAANAQVLLNSRTGQPFSCPDPSAQNYQGATYMVCTPDFDANEFAIWKSSDPNRQVWTRIGYVFPAGQHPAWQTGARAWAGDLHYFNGEWVVYFAMQATEYGNPDSWVIGMATAKQVTGPWSNAHIVHYLGQFPGTTETSGGVIDPGEAQDPSTGQRYLVWSQQPYVIWIAPLTSDGMAIEGGTIHQILDARSDPADCEAQFGCCAEGSSLTFHNGHAVLLYSVRSTWDRSYAMREAVAYGDPMGDWTIDPGYVLQAGGSYGPGGGAAPVLIGHQWVEFYHAMSGLDLTHVSNVRMGMSGTLTWNGDQAVVGNGFSGSLSSYSHTLARQIARHRSSLFAASREARRRHHV